MALSVCIYIQLELLVRNPCFDVLSLIHSLNTPPSMIIHPPVVFSQSIPFSPPQSVLPPSSFPLSPLIIMSRHVFDIRLLLSLFLPFFHLSCCISINLLLSSKALWGEGAGGVWAVAEEAFWVHQQPDENRLHHHSAAQGNHTHSPCTHTSPPRTPLYILLFSSLLFCLSCFFFCFSTFSYLTLFHLPASPHAPTSQM